MSTNLTTGPADDTAVTAALRAVMALDGMQQAAFAARLAAMDARFADGLGVLVLDAVALTHYATSPAQQEATMKPKEFVKYRTLLRRRIEAFEKEIEFAWEEEAACPPPADLRPATPADIVVGNVIWYTDTDEGSARWCVVEEVLNPSNKWKAYLWDGARYGLDNAYVERAQ